MSKFNLIDAIFREIFNFEPFLCLTHILYGFNKLIEYVRIVNDNNFKS